MRPRNKPAHLAQIGGKTNRQRIWEAIRTKREGFTCYGLARAADVDDPTVRAYLEALLAGGYLEAGPFCGEAFADHPLRLVRDVGAEAPAICRDGRPNRQGLISEALWRSLRILGEATAQELADQASMVAPTTLHTVKSWLLWLKRAGYVQVVRTGRSYLPAIYRLAPGKYSGPRPPVIQHISQVYDPNLGKVVYRREPEEQVV